ncbi:hypothetical protein [Psychroserpens luteolus]|uniref:hypothetical protein n=1 Tax=Psychroserpens luteolus TaxID=2855840 RepID=UPI001E52CD57|nr:hypothetical protein [Psychroserpens luteolus]MCD2260776.1 hypothetical protein [Psychroserpens luteolus]
MKTPLVLDLYTSEELDLFPTNRSRAQAEYFASRFYILKKLLLIHMLNENVI